MPNADRTFDMVGGALPAVDEVRVLLTTDSLVLTGWKSVRITRSIEYATSSFELTCSADANALKLVSKEGAPIKISLGEDLVLSGYVDTVENILTARDHLIRLSGRGKCSDLVDCSCRIDQIHPNTTLQALAESVANPYSIDVFIPPNGTQKILDALPVLPRQMVSITETAWEVIEHHARYCGMLVFESEEGELTISTAGTEIGSSGLAVGANIEAITCMKTTAGTFSTYNAVLSAYSSGSYDENIPNMPAVTIVAQASRLRPLYYVSEQSPTDRAFVEKRVNWMASRAYGRSRRVRILTDSWRSSDGSPWYVNTNYPISAPDVGIPEQTMLLLTDVTFILDDHGTHAELGFGPRVGYLPEPIVLDVLPMDEVAKK